MQAPIHLNQELMADRLRNTETANKFLTHGGTTAHTTAALKTAATAAEQFRILLTDATVVIGLTAGKLLIAPMALSEDGNPTATLPSLVDAAPVAIIRVNLDAISGTVIAHDSLQGDPPAALKINTQFFFRVLNAKVIQLGNVISATIIDDITSRQGNAASISP